MYITATLKCVEQVSIFVGKQATVLTIIILTAKIKLRRLKHSVLWKHREINQ